VKAVVQRVSRASVDVGGERIAEIATGLLVLVGVTHGDSTAQAEVLARKIHGVRLLRGERSLADEPAAAVLVVSQFTLYGTLVKGRRPSWSDAARGEVAEPLVDAFVAALQAHGIRVETGIFGTDMQVESINDGPVTLLLEV
jgi:D-tyrosyl-tRNA(Tyr) deacylase